MIAYIGLGSNLQQPKQQILMALDTLRQIPELTVLKISALYQSKALTLADSLPQGDYINAVAKLDSGLSAEQLLSCLQSIEHQQGRVRTEKWGARILDLDILLYEDEIISTESLVVPHAQIKFRNFVIHPLFEIAGDINIPGLGSLAQLAGQTDWSGLNKMQIDI